MYSNVFKNSQRSKQPLHRGGLASARLLLTDAEQRLPPREARQNLETTCEIDTLTITYEGL